IEPERVLEGVEALAGHLVAAVGDPAVGLEKDRRTEIAVAVPPVARAGGLAAEAENALPQPVQPAPLLRALQPLAIGRRRRFRLQPGLDRGELRVRDRQ